MSGVIHVVEFEPVRATVNLAPHVSVDGADVRCALETYWCKNKASQAGGCDIHHQWPKSMGGPEEATDTQHLLYLCPLHHRRQHSLIRAMVESGTTSIKTVRKFSNDEVYSASYAVMCWVTAGKPRIAGWECHAAALAA